MTKAVIEFELDHPADKEDFDLFFQSRALHAAMWDFDQHLRNILKYGKPEYEDEEGLTIENIRKDFHDFLANHDVELDLLS